MSANGEVGESKHQRTEQQSLRSSVSDSSLTIGEVTEPVVASPQSFAALKQAFDFMLPQYKALQTENRTLHKEKEELRKKLTEKETLSLDMSNHSQELPDDLRSKGQSAIRRSVVPATQEYTGTSNSENAENCRISPCGGSDSVIILNDGGNFPIEKIVREERAKWLVFTFQLMLHLPEDKLKLLMGIPEHCLDHLWEFIPKTDDHNRGLVTAKLIKLKNSSAVSDGITQMRTSQLVTPQDAAYGLMNHGDIGTVRGSPTGKSLPISSDEDPSDEDIYTSGYPTKRRMKPNEDDDDHEWVRVENAVGVLEKCASYIHQSLEVHEIFRRKLEESQRGTESNKLPKRDEGIGSSIGVMPPDLPPPPIPSRSNPPVPMSQVRPSPRRLDHIRQQYPSTASDPGRASAALSQLTLNRQFFSDPVVAGDPRYNSPKKMRRPRSATDIPTPLQELSVKYPPLPYGAGSSYTSRSYSDSQRQSPLDVDHQSPVTIDQNSFQFNDGQTYQPCGPPEPDFKKYSAQDEEDEDLMSWNAARNPDMFQQAASPVRFSRSDPNKRCVPSGSGGMVGESYGQTGQLPRSSDRIYDMTPPGFQFDTLTSAGLSTGTQRMKPHIEGPECPVCRKKFDPNTSEVAVSSHVNLHFENEKFEIIE